MAGHRQRNGCGPKLAQASAERRRARLADELAQAATPSELIGAATGFLQGAVKAASPADAERVAGEAVAFLTGHGEALLKLNGGRR